VSTTHVRETSTDALADWAIATGRLGLSDRRAWLDLFSVDPVIVTGTALCREPTRDPQRRAPIFGTEQAVSAVVRQGHRARKVRRSAVAQVVAARSTVAAVADPIDPAIRDAVTTALRELANTEAKRERREARTRLKMVERDTELFGYALAEGGGGRLRQVIVRTAWDELHDATRRPWPPETKPSARPRRSIPAESEAS
jgi:hypothetical protein